MSTTNDGHETTDMKTTYLAGVEEAGRGPVIGPMVMVIAAVPLSKESQLRGMGVKDSKLLTPNQREAIFEKLQGNVVYKVKVLSPAEIDAAVTSEETNLNWLEANISAGLINQLAGEIALQKVILDCPSTNIKAYTAYVKERVQHAIPLLAEHKADVNYPIVSAASILAKVLRDREIEKLKKIVVEDFGSGYPSDPRTVEFLKKHHKTYADAGIFRKSWSTYQNLTKPQQKRLGEY